MRGSQCRCVRRRLHLGLEFDVSCEIAGRPGDGHQQGQGCRQPQHDIAAAMRSPFAEQEVCFASFQNSCATFIQRQRRSRILLAPYQIESDFNGLREIVYLC